MILIVRWRWQSWNIGSNGETLQALQAWSTTRQTSIRHLVPSLFSKQSEKKEYDIKEEE